MGRSLPSWPTARPLRAWQQAAAAAVFDHDGDAFLASATPAAGKTTFGLHVAHRMLTEGRVARVAVVAPTTHICRQWALDAARYGIQLEPNRPNSAGPEPRDRHGVAVTYATVAAGPEVHRRRCAERPTLLIADEPHHMGEDATWGRDDDRGLQARPLPAAALGHAVSLGQLADPVGQLRRRRRLARGLRLRLHAGADRRRLPPGDVPHLRRRHGVGERRARAPRGLRRRAARRRGRAPAAHGAGPGRRLDHPRAARRRRASCAICAPAIIPRPAASSSRSTRSTPTSSPTGWRGSPASGRTSCTPTPRTPRRGSRASPPAPRRWLVSVLMVSEGVDVPRLRVGVYATTARTELFFRQVIGRFIRRTPAPKDQMSHVFLPSDPRLKRLATEIEEERNHALVFEPAGEPVAERGERAEPARPSARCGRARAATTTCCRRPSPATRCSSSPSPPRRLSPALAAFTTSRPRPLRRSSPRRRSSGASACAPSGTRSWPRSRAGPARSTARSTRASTARSARMSVNKSTDEQLEKANRLLEREVTRRSADGRAPVLARRDRRGALDRRRTSRTRSRSRRPSAAGRGRWPSRWRCGASRSRGCARTRAAR